jgi:hypothetical protein
METGANSNLYQKRQETGSLVEDVSLRNRSSLDDFAAAGLPSQR